MAVLPQCGVCKHSSVSLSGVCKQSSSSPTCLFYKNGIPKEMLLAYVKCKNYVYFSHSAEDDDLSLATGR